MTTTLENVAWIHGCPDCTDCADPVIQVHQFDPNTFVLRVSKCFSFEGNFIYLLIGTERAILFDTGGRADSQIVGAGSKLPIRDIVEQILLDWQTQNSRNDPPELIVAHTHNHSDHAFWDTQFENRQNTILIAPTPAAVRSFFALSDWPNGSAELGLGERRITVMPIPGHEDAHIAVHDESTKLLLTGDTFYPGVLTVRDWPSYRNSAAKLAAFADKTEVRYVLGAHIEMKQSHGKFYPIGTTFQPEEHVLPLAVSHLREWNMACEAMGDFPHRDVHNDFIIEVI